MQRMKTPIIDMQELVEIARGQLHGRGTQRVLRVLTDSRSLVEAEGTLFFALTTGAGDGHRYIDNLYSRGVRAFVVEHSGSHYLAHYPDASFCQVQSSLHALQALARGHRQRLEDAQLREVIGITGSNGKTIVKEMLSTLLRPYYPKLGRSPGSYNSQIGVPLSLLSLSCDTDLALLEAGISRPGEMEVLAEMIRPTVVLLTNVGSAHSQNFAGIDALVAEKLRLAVAPEVRQIVCCVDDERVMSHIARLGLLHKVCGYSLNARQAYVSAHYRYEGHGLCLTLHIEDRTYTVHLSQNDTASLHNTLVSLTTIASLLGGHLPEAMLSQLNQIAPLQMRLELLESRTGTTIINDSYSCDLEAMTVALDFARRRATLDEQGGEVSAVLSDIEGSELSSEELYARLGQLLARYGVAHVYAIGEHISRHSADWQCEVRAFASVEHLLDSEDAVKGLLSHPYLLVKGARRFGFERIVRMLSMREHQTQLEVNLSSLRANLAHYRALLPPAHRIICMIKAEAYGLGAYEIARVLQESGVDCLAVAVADEGKALRRRGITTPIIVMNPDLNSLDTLATYALDLEVYSIEMLRAVIDYQQRHATSLGIHLKVDTAMHRLGLSPSDVEEVAHLYIHAGGRLRLSVFSHLAAADMPEQDDFTHEQAARLDTFCRDLTLVVQRLSEGAIRLESLPRHLLNTAGIERFASLYAYDAVRLGIGLYGESPMMLPQIEPVARLTTTILQTKWIGVGETVGYGRAFCATRPTRIGILPIGYADGLSRQLGGGVWHVTVHGVPCPIIGRVCMDTCMIDLTDVPPAVEGDRVTIFGEGGLSLRAMANVLDTISYEILTRLSPRVVRVYLRG